MTASKLEQCFRDKTVLITGHTGFKGSWLSIWMHSLGARVIGLSDGVPTEPSNFMACDIASIVTDHRADVRDRQSVGDITSQEKPDFVFHLAAQAIVKQSYTSPLDTLNTNVIGTANVLDALSELSRPCIAIMVTSDKCYDNVEWEWGYRETDTLGGKDPYSASKGAAELVIRTYAKSFFKSSPVRVGVGRAGNVIGGGDWAPYRLVPDCILSWAKGEPATIHNPGSTRPWQLVLEPLSGYISLALALSQSADLHGQAFNFGPLAENDYSVRTLIDAMGQRWGKTALQIDNTDAEAVYEAGLLKLNCDKALHRLRWRPTYDFEQTVQATIDWYRNYYDTADGMMAVSKTLLTAYQEQARAKKIDWAV